MLLQHLAQAALEKFDKPAFIICSTSLTTAGVMLDGETLIRSIEKVVGPQVSMFGGMAGDDMTFKGTYVFANEQSTDYGVAALVLNEDKIAMQGVALSGWKPIGVSRTITKEQRKFVV
ncbi:MAG: FIST N-terminal domain-containing protein [Nocardioidaceae bacterium]